MEKIVFVDRIDGKFIPCPFMGHRVKSADEFKEVIKGYREDWGYPGLVFSTDKKNIKIFFSGHQYEHPTGTMFTIVDVSKDFDYTKWEWKTCSEVYDYLCDAKDMDKRVKALDAIFKSGVSIGIEIKL